HSHIDYFGFPLAQSPERPFVTTLHGRLDRPELFGIYRAFSELPLVSISDSQRRPLASANWVDTVHHGIELDHFTFNPRQGRYLAFLARFSPGRGADRRIGGPPQPASPCLTPARPPLPFNEQPEFQRDREYFEHIVTPLLNEPGIELIGEVGGEDKDDF